MADFTQPQRRFDLSRAMMQQAMAPTRNAGPVEGLAKILSTYFAAKGMRNAEGQENAIREAEQRKQANRGNQLMTALTGAGGAGIPGETFEGSPERLTRMLVGSSDPAERNIGLTQALAKPKDDRAAKIKAFEQARSAGYIPPDMNFAEFAEIGNAGTTINMPPPSPREGYQNVFDPTGRLIRQDIIPGSDVDRKRQAEEAKSAAEANAASQQSSMQQVKNTEFLGQIDNALENNSFWTTGMLGKVLSVWPSSDARMQEKLLERIQGEVALERLSQAQQASKTGGVFGSLQKAELDLLKNSLEALEVGMSEENMERGLLGIKEHRLKWEGYDELWNDPDARSRNFAGFGRYIREDGGVEILDKDNFEKFQIEARTGIKQNYSTLGIYK